jgi:hypothetical protein
VHAYLCRQEWQISKTIGHDFALVITLLIL